MCVRHDGRVGRVGGFKISPYTWATCKAFWNRFAMFRNRLARKRHRSPGKRFNTHTHTEIQRDFYSCKTITHTIIFFYYYYYNKVLFRFVIAVVFDFYAYCSIKKKKKRLHVDITNSKQWLTLGYISVLTRYIIHPKEGNRYTHRIIIIIV